MNRGLTFILGIVLGALVGGLLVLYFLSPRSAAILQGAPIQPPAAEGMPSGTAVIQLNQFFFSSLLHTIFREGSPPTFPLCLTGQATDQPLGEIQCGKITLKPEGSGAATGVKLENGEILVPIAFAGNFNALGNCLEFNGWAQAKVELRFDEEQQVVFGQINVQTVNLDGVAPVVSGLVTPLVQSTLNSRVNPLQILRGEQIAMKVPIQSAQSTLQARVKDVRSEIKDTSLFLYVAYNFTAEKSLPPPPPTP